MLQNEETTDDRLVPAGGAELQRRVASARLPQRRDGSASARQRRLEAVRPRPGAGPRTGARGPQVRREAQRQQESRHSGGQERHRRHTDEPDICEYFGINTSTV